MKEFFSTINMLGFVHWKIQIRVGNNDYIADVVQEDLSKKGLIFCDIVDIQPTTIKEADKSHTRRKAKKTFIM